MSQIEWIHVPQIRRTERYAAITLMPAGLKLSAAFVGLAGIGECTHATVLISKCDRHMALRFSKNDGDEYVLSKQNRNAKSTGGRIISARNLVKLSPRMAALVRLDAGARTFTPRKLDGQWVINIAPCFEHSVATPDGLPAGSGIYRYMSGAECIYIGRGAIKMRAMAPERREWRFDRIEYSLLNDPAAEETWESYWLAGHQQQHAKLPAHNRILGKTIEPA